MTKLRSLIVIISLIVAGPSDAARPAIQGPILVGQGGGQSEFSLVFAHQNLNLFLSTCLSATCQLSTVEKSRLRVLLNRFKIRPPQAVFKSTNELGTMLFAVDSVANSVDINKDLLWLDAGGTIAYDIPSAVVFWLDVLAQLDPSSSKALDSELKAKVHLRILDKLSKAQVNFNSGNNFEALVWRQQSAHDRLFIRDSEFNSFDFTPLILSGELCFAGRPSALRINTVRWAWLNPRGETALRMGLELIMNWDCSGSSHRGRAKLVLSANGSGAAFKIDSTNAEFFLEGE